MNHAEKYSDEELLEMREIAINFCWHAKIDNAMKDVVEIARIEINRELDTRKLRKAGNKMSEPEIGFENAQTGDRCYSPLFKSVNPDDKTNAKIIEIDEGKIFPVIPEPDVENIALYKPGFTRKGEFWVDTGQVLFWENPIKEIPTRPKRKVIKTGYIGVIPTKNGSYLANTTNIHASQVAIAEILPNCKHQIIPVEFEVYE